MPTYNKLVRDKMPAIIEDGGSSCRVMVMKEEDYIRALKKKAEEELGEYLDATNREEAIEELADLTEVIYTLAIAQGFSVDELEMKRKQKEEMRGGFAERLFLIDVDEGGM